MSLTRWWWWAALLLTTLNSCLYGQMNREVVGFVYHRVGDDRYPSTNISIQDFESHLKYLQQNKFKVLTTTQATEYLKQPGEREKVAMITFDDGYESFFQNGVPLLKKYGFAATVFVNTETVGGSSYMDWEQLKECLASNIEIGNHSDSHAYFLNEKGDSKYTSFENDVRRSQDIIKGQLGFEPKVFAYPYGEFDLEMTAIIKKMGFDAALAQNSGVMYAQSDFYRLPRFPMASAFSALEKFISKANMRAFKMTGESPASFVMQGAERSPQLTLKFQKNHLQLSDIQCFVQGGSCVIKQSVQGENVELLVKPAQALTGRRTLYTLTIKDGDGQWHWFSHLWINPSVR